MKKAKGAGWVFVLLMAVSPILLLAVSTPTATIDLNEYRREAIRAAMDRVRGSLYTRSDQSNQTIRKQQTGSGNWTVLEDTSSDFLAATPSSPPGAVLAIGCSDDIQDDVYAVTALWTGPKSLGTYYSDLQHQPITLNWRRPNLTQHRQWRHFSIDDADAVIVTNLSDESEVENFLNRLSQHSELEVVVTLSPGGATKSATFQVAGAPVDQVRQACGDAVTPPPTPTDSDLPTLVFPQYVNGMYEGFTNFTRLILRNLAAIDDPVTVSYLDSSGQVVNSQTHTVPARGTIDVRSSGTGPLMSGPLTVTSQSRMSQLHGTVMYDFLGYRVSVPDSKLTIEAEVFVSKSADENTGLALYNPSATDTITLSLGLYAASGQGVWRTPVTLSPGQHFARFVDDASLFSGYLNRQTRFTGHTVITSSGGEGFAVAGLLQDTATGALAAVSSVVR